MRLLGVRWLTHQLYPDFYPIDKVAETRNFYQLFLNVTLDEAAARELLKK
jgi:iron complex transport system substrate-binding protein